MKRKRQEKMKKNNYSNSKIEQINPEVKEDSITKAQIDITEELKPKRKWKAWKIAAVSLGGVSLALIGCVLCIGNSMLNRINYETPDQIQFKTSDITPRVVAETTPTFTPTPIPTPEPDIEDQVINIVLIGEEAVHDDVGRSDSMLIATINTQQNTLKVTSLMRDILVKIPGYLDNKLNAAFHNGGGVLLSQTIEENFGIKIDGYVRVNFEGFEKIIDRLGGVEIYLTQEEADYLNTHDYISKPSNRTVKAGTQQLNGNQALGFCRVRYVNSSTKEDGDFGRTARHRMVLNSIFEQYKSKNLVDMISIANELMDDITTNLNQKEILKYITAGAGVIQKNPKLETFRMPVEGAYTAKKAQAGLEMRYVIEMDKEVNHAELVRFLYGEDKMKEFGVSPSMLVDGKKSEEENSQNVQTVSQ